MAELSGFDSWKRARPSEGRRGRRTRMAVVGTLALATVAALFYALFEPFTAPDVHLFAVHLGEAATGGALPPTDSERDAVRYAARDSAAFQRLAERIHRYAPDHAAPRINAAEKSTDLKSLGGQLLDAAPNSGHVVILYLASTGVSMDGEAFLEWPASEPPFFSNKTGAPRRVRATELLEQIGRSKAKIKLLLLDAGHQDFSVRNSAVVNAFTPLLKAAVEKTGNQSLWVLVSHSALENSHVSHRFRRSYFSLAVTDALNGAADRDQNGQIEIGELYRYVAANVSANVRRATGQYQSQTPVFCWGGGTAMSRKLADRLIPTLKNGAPGRLALQESALFPADLTAKTASEWLSPSPRRASTTIPSLPPMLAALSAAGRKPDSGETPESSAPETPGKTGTKSPAARNGKTPAPKTGQPKASAVAGAAPANAEKKVSTPGNIAARLAAAWMLRDRLTDRSDPRDFGKSPGSPTPVDFAPHLWRRLEARLLQCERQYRVDGPFVAAESDDKSKPPAWPRAALMLSRELDDVLRLMQTLGSRQPLDSVAVTPLEKDIVAFYTASKRRPSAPRSLGMAERDPRDSSKSPGSAAAAELDRLIGAGTMAEFTAWGTKLSEAQLQFVELELARRLAVTTHLNWVDVRLALAARRYSEQVAAFAADEWAWVGDDLLAADRLRNSAERQLLDGIGADYRRRFRNVLAAAVQRYASVAERLRVLRDGRSAYRDAAYQAADVVRWHHATDFGPEGHGPTPQQVRQLLTTLKDLAARLDAPSVSNANAVRRLTAVLRGVQGDLAARGVASLQPAVDRLLAGRDPLAGDRLRLDTALQLPLIAGDLRLKALQAADRLSHSKADSLTRDANDWSGPDQRVVSHDDWGKLLVRAELDVLLAQAALLAPADSLPEVAPALQALQNAGNETESRWAAHRRLATALRQARSRLPQVLMATAQTPGKIDAVIRRGRVLVTMPPSPFDANDLIRRRALYRALQRERVARQRSETALSDASPPETRFLTSTGGPLAVDAAPVEIDAPGSVSLVETPSASVTIRVRNPGTQPRTIKTVVEFDGQLLEVTPEAGDAGLLVRGRSAVQRTATASGLALDTAFAAAADVSLRDSSTHEVRLTLRRKDVRTSLPTRLVVHVQSGSRVVRQSTTIALPSAKSLELLVRTPGIDGPTVGRQNGLAELHPFPNRKTGFQFQLRSLRRVDRTVDVQLLIPQRGLPSLPVADLSPTEFASWRDRMGTLKLLAEQKGLKLPGDGSTVRVSPKPVASAKPQAAGGGPPTLAKIDFGMLVVVRDQRSGHAAVRPLKITVQRPRRFIAPRVAFNAETRRLDIQIAPRNLNWLPAESVAVNCQIVPKLPDGTEASLAGELTTKKPELKLFAIVPEQLGPVVRLNVHVDGVLRAFVFQVPVDRTTESVPEEVARRSVRLFVDEKARLVSGPAPTVAARLEVDAPVGSFESGGDRVEVGVDAGRDRRLEGDVFRTLPSDRETTAAVEEITDDGNVVIRSSVTDWKIDVSLKDFRNRKVDLLARLVAGNRTAWSNSVPVLADDRPPTIEPPRNLSTQEGQPLALSITATDEHLAGVEKVEIAVDPGSGQFAKDPPPSAASPGNQGRWEAKVPTDKLRPGRYRLLIRATDRAGNAGEIVKAPFLVLSKKDLETRGRPKPNRVEGVVLWDGDVIPDATVALTQVDSKTPAKIPPVTTDKNGEFQFPTVPPGKYVLSAKKAALANKNRSVEAKLTVPELPETVPLQRVEFP
jgi:Carboxypeptidase regulatory-like domain